MDTENLRKKEKKSKPPNHSACEIEIGQNNNGVSSNDNITSSKRRRIRRKISLKKRAVVDKNHIDKKISVNFEEISKELPLLGEKDSLNKVNNLFETNLSEFNEKVVEMDAKKDKPREEVKANREAKKLAKQLAKNKIKNEPVDQIDSSVEKNKVAVIKVAPPESPKKDSNIKGNIADVTAGVAQIAIEKSREEIKAEREAKKLAKKNQKGKVSITDAKPNETPEEIEKVTPTVKSAPINKDQIVSEKSKADLRAERRAIQEAQRAAKTVAKPVAPKTEKNVDQSKMLKVEKDIVVRTANTPEKTKPKATPGRHHKVKLFNHLYSESSRKSLNIPLNSKEIHRAIVRLGVQYASHTVIGSNARCIALLSAIKQVVSDYNLPPNVEFSRGFEAHLAPSIKFLNACRTPSVSMNNALKHIKWQLTQLSHTTSENEGKSKLHEAIDVYIKDQIEVAGKAISVAVTNKITNDDVILTYGCSSLIEHILVDAVAEKTFRVVVVEAHPWNEGREMLRRLTSKGIKCSLVMISALSFVMREINKVILGAGALLANGYVMARAGTAQVAMVAHAHNVPVLVCCETHKFSERVQTDSFVYNEIGDPDDLIKCNTLDTRNRLANWRTFNSLTPLNLFYDVTPPDLVTAVVTELAILPCTSVPVILRMKPSEFM